MPKRRKTIPDGPMVADVRETRRKLAADFDFDLRRLVAALREHEAAAGRRPVCLHKRKVYRA